METDDKGWRGGTEFLSRIYPPMRNLFFCCSTRLKEGIELLGRHPLATGALAILGILGLLLSVISYRVDRQDALSTTDQVANVGSQLESVEENLQSQISINTTSVVNQISEVLQIDAALIEEGPIRDLARLEKNKDPTKIQATAKLSSPNEKVVLEGANLLLDFASEKAESILAISVSVAEDYREAGAAFLLAKDLQSAFLAYEISTRFDPTNGFLSLSKIAFAMNDLQAAEVAALSALEYSEGFAEIFSLEQIIKVLIAKQDIVSAQPYVYELDEVTKKDVMSYSALNRGTLLEVGIDAVKMRTPQKTSLKMYWAGRSTGTLEVVDGLNMSEAQWEKAMEVAAEYTMAVISRETRLIALSSQYDFYSQQNSVEAEKYYLEAIDTALDILTLINEYNRAPTVLLPHIESYSNYLKSEGRNLQRVEIWRNALEYQISELAELQENYAWIDENDFPVEVVVEQEKESILGQADFETENSLQSLSNLLLQSLSSTYFSYINAQVDANNIDGSLSSAQDFLLYLENIESSEIPISTELLSLALSRAKLNILDIEYVSGNSEIACAGYENIFTEESNNDNSFLEIVEERKSNLCSPEL